MKRARRVLGSASLFGAALLASACSLMIDSESGVPAEQGEPALMPMPGNGGSAGAGSSEPSAGGSVSATGAGGQDAGDAELDASDVAVPSPEVLDGSSPPFVQPSSVVYLAFIEDPDEAPASLRLVNARDALSSSEQTDAAPAWRQTLRPQAQTGSALDFAWSPDGKRIALRYEAIDAARIAFFEAPEWRELTAQELDTPASQPRFSAAPSYQWSPDSLALAAELSSEQGPFVGGYSIREQGAVAVQPVAFTGPLESMAWHSPSVLYVVQPESDAREIVALTLGQDAFEAAVLPTIRFAYPLRLRRIPAGILGASLESDSFLFFWPALPDPELEAIYSGSAYVSGQQAFVAEPDAELGVAALYSMGGLLEPLDTLPDCPVVLAWADEPTSGSLANSKVACLRVRDAAATISVYSFAANGLRTAITLDDEALRTDFVSEANWEAHARSFSVDAAWLSIATEAHDVLVDLRAPAPKYQLTSATSTGPTARGFSPSGKYLLQQRGQAIQLTVLSPGKNGAPISFALDAANGPAACATARHLADWCGAPYAAAAASARWASLEDVLVLLSRDEGLTVLAFTEAGDGLVSRAVSTCGAACVTRYEFGP